MPNQFYCEVKRAGGFHEYICVFTGHGRFSKNEDESKSVQNRWQLNEFL